MSNRTIKPDAELEGAAYAKAAESRNDPNYDKDVQKKLKAMQAVDNGSRALRLCEDCADGEEDHVKIFFAALMKRPKRRAFMNALAKVCGVKTWEYDRAAQAGDTPDVTQDQLHSPPVHTFIQDQRPSFTTEVKPKRKARRA